MDLKKLIAAILACELLGALGSFFTMPAIPTWYASLIKPVFNPPNWIFGPVWTTLFLLMGVSLYLVWVKKNKHKKTALIFFAVQFALNILWSALFFGLKSPLAGFIEILALWATILLMILTLRKVSKPAAYLQIPYLVWVSFAAILNLSILVLNI